MRYHFTAVSMVIILLFVKFSENVDKLECLYTCGANVKCY